MVVTWGVTSPAALVTDAVDTFVFADDKIRLHTTVFRLQPSAGD